MRAISDWLEGCEEGGIDGEGDLEVAVGREGLFAYTGSGVLHSKTRSLKYRLVKYSGQIFMVVKFRFDTEKCKIS